MPPIIVRVEGLPTMRFPEGTERSVIDAKVKEVVAASKGPGSEDAPVTMGEPSVDLPLPQPPPPEPTFTETLAADAPALVGATALGVGAAMTGAGLPLTAGLAALGGAGGEGYKILGEHLSGSLSAPKTSLEAAKRVGAAGAEQGAWELVGGLAWTGAAKTIGKMKPKVLDGVRDAKAYFGDRIKPLFLPSEATESRTLDLLDNVAESSLIGGNTIAQYKVNRAKFFNDFADNLIAQFGESVDPSDLGELFVKSIEDGKAIHRKASDVLYNVVSDMTQPITVKETTTELTPSSILGPNGQPVMKSVDTTKDKVIPAVNVSTKSLKKFAKSIQANSSDLGGIEAKNAGDDLVAAISDLPDTIGFNQARELRSRLISRIDEFSVMNKKAPAIGKAKRMTEMIDQEISGALKAFDAANGAGSSVKAATGQAKIAADQLINGITRESAGDLLAMGDEAVLQHIKDGISTHGVFAMEDAIRNQITAEVAGAAKGTERKAVAERIKSLEPAINQIFEDAKAPNSAYDAWRTANRFYKEGQARLNNTMIRRLVKFADDTGTGAEMIAPAIFRPGKISTVQKVKAAVDPQTWGKLQGFFMQDFLQRATDVNGEIVGKRIINNISGKPGSYGEPMLREILSGEQLNSLKQFGRALQLTQERQAEGAGRMLIQFAQAGAIASFAMGKAKPMSGAVILGPQVLAKMMTNPRTNRLLIEGISLPEGSKNAPALLNRIVAEYVKYTTEDSSDENQ